MCELVGHPLFGYLATYLGTIGHYYIVIYYLGIVWDYYFGSVMAVIYKFSEPQKEGPNSYGPQGLSQTLALPNASIFW